MQRYLCQQRHAQLFCLGGDTAMPKDMFLVPAVGTDMRAHVFNHPDDRRLELVEHVDPLAGIQQRYILRCANNNCAVHMGLLRQGHLHIAGAGRQIDDQHIQCAPLHLHHHLLQCAHQHRTAPDHRLIVVGHQSDRHHCHAKVAHRQDRFTIRRRRPAGNTQHPRLRRTVDIGIQHAHAAAFGGQRTSKIRSNGRFPDATLA